jgi:isopentenyldiphosphate isomerase
MDEMFDVVDLSDQIVGQETRSFVHERGYFHRAVHIMIERPSGYWVLQQRASTKDLDPFLWTSSCSGHVDAGESYLDAAVRECMEELSIKVKKHSFKEIFRCSPCKETGNEFVRVYKLFYEREIVFNPLEINRIKNFTFLEMKEFIENFSDEVSLSLRHLFAYIQNSLLDERSLS